MFQKFLDRLLARWVVKRIIVRLDPSILADLRRKVGGTCVVTSQTTQHMAGYQLGVAHVLNVLQEGYTVSRP